MRRPTIPAPASLVLSAALLGAPGPAAHHEGEVPDSPEKVTPPEIGQTIPQVTVKTVEGEPFDVSAAVAEQPTVLIFYRGGW